MKLHLTTSDSQHLITGYGDDYIAVNDRRYASNMIVTPNEMVADWYTGSLKSIAIDDFAEIIRLKPEVLILGTGATHQFIHPKHYANLTEQNIPLECMTTAAACRTYNILMSEGRNVAAAILLSA